MENEMETVVIIFWRLYLRLEYQGQDITSLDIGSFGRGTYNTHGIEGRDRKRSPRNLESHLSDRAAFLILDAWDFMLCNSVGQVGQLIAGTVESLNGKKLENVMETGIIQGYSQTLVSVDCMWRLWAAESLFRRSQASSYFSPRKQQPSTITLYNLNHTPKP